LKNESGWSEYNPHKGKDPAQEHNRHPRHGRWDEGIEGKEKKDPERHERVNTMVILDKYPPQYGIIKLIQKIG